jgi:hypothetical protein
MEIIDKTSWLAAAATRRNYSPSLLWLRGIVPYWWGQGMVQRRPQDDFEWKSGQATFHEDSIFTDGAGEGASFATAFGNTVGSAAVGLQWTPNGRDILDFQAILSSVPGAQTVPRAETRAALAAAEMAAEANLTQWSLVTDAMYVVQGMGQIQNTNEGTAFVEQGSN